ncbi:MAG: energy-coupling factor transporter transmembrane component T [Acidobacteria bacterium]|nr:energy-coupling factor transporter transmembrane component T [Acidobacteriota bacterium]
MATPAPAVRLGLLMWSVVLGVVSSGWKLGVVLAGTLALAAMVRPSGLRVLRRPALWFSLVALLVLPLFLIEPRDLPLAGGLTASSAGVTLGLSMVVRAIVITVAAAGFSTTVSIRELADLLEAAGLRGLGFALGVAVHSVQHSHHVWMTTAKAFRLRGGFRTTWWRDGRLLLVTVVSTMLRRADETVAAAQARAFSPDRIRPAAPRLSAPDWWWIALLTAVAAALLVV